MHPEIITKQFSNSVKMQKAPIFTSILIFLITIPLNVEALRLLENPPLKIIPGGAVAGAAGAVQDLLAFADQRLETVFPVIQRFKNLITSDPFNITATWVGADICKYRGFYCEPPPDNASAIAVASIDFNGFQLSSPTLVGFLDLLPDIALFHANSNNFGGVIPPNIAKLRFLYELDISNNKFSGQFPAAILAMDGLSFLDIRFNSFSGGLPPEIFTKLNLDALFLNNNNFMTNLPDNIQFTHITYLTLANNKFFGPIPRDIARALSGSSEILLSNNFLSGCLPSEIGLLKDAVVFDAGNNNLTGPLPVSLGCLEKLEVLNFAGNLLYGNIPDELCQLGNLANLSLSDNYFTQAGVDCMRLIRNGVLDVRRNCIPGQGFQRPVAECAAFLAKPKYCSYMKTYSQVPCRIPGFGSAPESAASPT